MDINTLTLHQIHTLLTQAIEDNDNETITQLLPYCDIHYNRDELLRAAVRAGNLQLVKELVSRGCEVTSETFNVATKWGVIVWLWEKLRDKSELLNSIDNPLVVRFLLPYISGECTRNLIFFSEKGHYETSKLLLPYSDPKAEDSYVLFCVSIKGHYEISKLLLPYSDPKAKDSRALEFASGNGRYSVVKLLLPYCDPKVKNSFSLGWASAGKYETSKLLLPYSDPKARDSDALRYACVCGYPEIVRLLLPYSDPTATRYPYFKDRRVVSLLLPYRDPRADNSYDLYYTLLHGLYKTSKLLLPYSDPKAATIWFSRDVDEHGRGANPNSRRFALMFLYVARMENDTDSNERR